MHGTILGANCPLGRQLTIPNDASYPALLTPHGNSDYVYQLACIAHLNVLIHDVMYCQNCQNQLKQAIVAMQEGSNSTIKIRFCTRVVWKCHSHDDVQSEFSCAYPECSTVEKLIPGAYYCMCAFCVLLILLVPIPTISLQVVIILLSELYECLPFVTM